MGVSPADLPKVDLRVDMLVPLFQLTCCLLRAYLKNLLTEIHFAADALSPPVQN